MEPFDTTRLAQALTNLGHEKVEHAFEHYYEALHELARRRLRRERPTASLQTTALAQNALFALLSDPSFQTLLAEDNAPRMTADDVRDAQHPHAAAVIRAMTVWMQRRLIDKARERMTMTRGGDSKPASAGDNELNQHQTDPGFLASIEHDRKRRIAAFRRVDLDEHVADALVNHPEHVVHVGALLSQLARGKGVDKVSNPARAAEVFRLHYFGRLSAEEIETVMPEAGALSTSEIAGELGITDRTVRRDLVMAKAWLQERLDALGARDK